MATNNNGPWVFYKAQVADWEAKEKAGTIKAQEKQLLDHWRALEEFDPSIQHMTLWAGTRFLKPEGKSRG